MYDREETIEKALLTAEEADLNANWENLTIQNRFIFAKVMGDEEIALPFLQRVFPDAGITRVRHVETEKTLEGSISSRGVRYDVYVKDMDGRAFTIEMQVLNRGNLPKRSRYYAIMMDEELLGHGQDYEALPPSWVIFICPFDLFGEGLHRYTFRNYCVEVDGLLLRDETEKVFLNTKSNADDIPAELRIILDYFDGRTEGKPTDPLLIRIQDAVARAKMNTEWRREYMLWQHELAHEKRLARQAGWDEGLRQGLDEGLRQGRDEGLRQGRDEGLRQGRDEGLRQGRDEGQEVVNRLITCLLQDGRLDELRQSSVDPALQTDLLKEYHLI